MHPLLRALKWLLLAFVAITFATLLHQELGADDGPPPMRWEPGDYVMVTYYHADKRCTLCNNMERFTAEALRRHFAPALANGRLRHRVLNWQRPAQRVHCARYGLMGNTVILSEIRNGRETRFLELEEVWSHAHDEAAFVAYVGDGLGRFMEGR